MPNMQLISLYGMPLYIFIFVAAQEAHSKAENVLIGGINCAKMRRKVWSGETVGTKPMTTSLADNMVRQHSVGSHMRDLIVRNLSDVRGRHSHQILYEFCHICIYRIASCPICTAILHSAKSCMYIYTHIGLHIIIQ